MTAPRTPAKIAAPMLAWTVLAPLFLFVALAEAVLEEVEDEPAVEVGVALAAG